MQADKVGYFLSPRRGREGDAKRQRHKGAKKPSNQAFSLRFVG